MIEAQRTTGLENFPKVCGRADRDGKQGMLRTQAFVFIAIRICRCGPTLCDPVHRVKGYQ